MHQALLLQRFFLAEAITHLTLHSLINHIYMGQLRRESDSRQTGTETGGAASDPRRPLHP